MRELSATVALLLLAASHSGAGAAEYTLEECERLAVERNERVKAAGADLEYYQGKYHEAQAAFWLPNVSATIMGGGPVAPENRTVDRVTDASNLGSLGVTGAGFVVQGSLDVIWPLYTFGRLGSYLSAAGSGIDAATAGVEAARDAVLMDTRKAYFGAVVAREVVSVLEDGKSRLGDARKKVKEILDADDPQATEKDLFKLDYYGAELESRLQEAKKGVAVAEAALRVMIGAGDDEQVVAKPIDLEKGLPDPAPIPEYLSDASKRSDIRALDHAVKARAGLADAAGSAYYPSLFVGGGLRFSRSSLDYQVNPWIRDDLNYLGGAVGLGLRLELDVGLKLAQEEQARAEYSKISFQSSLARRGAALQVRKAHAEYVQARAAWVSFRDGAKAARKWLTASLMGYNIGVGDTRELLDALVAQAQGRIQQIKAAYDAKVALSELELATGRIGGR